MRNDALGVVRPIVGRRRVRNRESGLDVLPTHSPLQEQLGDLHGIEGGAFADLVAAGEEFEAEASLLGAEVLRMRPTTTSS